MNSRNDKLRIVRDSPESDTDVAGGGGPPHDEDMKTRITKLEAIIPTLATKADLEKSSNDLVKWIVGTGAVGLGLALTIMTFVLNNAVPKQPAAPQPSPVTIQSPLAPPPTALQPIIIQLPAQPPSPAGQKVSPNPDR